MPLTVLTNGDVYDLLHTLTADDCRLLQGNLAESLHSYSTGDTNSSCCSQYQPQRTVIKKRGVTTLFMPASTATSVGMKIVSLETPEAPLKKTSTAGTVRPVGSQSSHDSASDGKKSSVSSASEMSMSGLTLTPASTMSSMDTQSTRSTTGSTFRPPPSLTSLQSTAPRGTVTMLDQNGHPVGIINAEEMTAFRTALASTILFQKREEVHTVTVFGAGKQAYWHIRLALLFKGDQIKHVNVINRSMEKSLQLMQRFRVPDGETRPWRKDLKFSSLSPDFVEYGRLLKEEVRKADVIFCCTPSLDPLFPAEFLTSREGQRKGRYIAAIGSYAPHMTELHPDIFKKATDAEHDHKGSHHHAHLHKHAKTSGVIVVDTLEGCLKEAGEVIQAKLKPEHLVEVGELMMIKKSVTREIELGGQGEKGLLEWLMRGNVIYKSVGLGLMDLCVGGDLLTLARERDIGTTIEDF